MLVLALDTTMRSGSCALARDGEVLRENDGGAARTQAERLPADLITLLRDAGVALEEIEVFAVATGPGSFTGLRVGIATMQGLAFAAGKPLFGVSTFEALATIAAGESRVDAPPPRIATWVDAWRGDVFAALYENGREAEPPSVASPGELLRRLGTTPTVFIGDGAALYRDMIRDHLGGAASIADRTAPPLAGTVAALATRRAAAGERPAPHAIRPLYVRRSDAELALLAKDVRVTR